MLLLGCGLFGPKRSTDFGAPIAPYGQRPPVFIPGYRVYGQGTAEEDNVARCSNGCGDVKETVNSS